MNEAIAIKGITISRSETYNLGDYSNVKPEIRLSVELGEGDDPALVIAALTAECRAYIHREIDAAREERGKPALYSDEFRVDVRKWDDLDCVLLVPAGSDMNLFNKANVGIVKTLHIPIGSDYSMQSEDQRYSYALNQVELYAHRKGMAVYDWSDLTPEQILERMWEMLETCWATTTITLRSDSVDHYRTLYHKSYAFVLPAIVAAEYQRANREGVTVGTFRYHPEYQQALAAAQKDSELVIPAETLEQFTQDLDRLIAARDATCAPGKTATDTGADDPQYDDEDEDEFEEEDADEGEEA